MKYHFVKTVSEKFEELIKKVTDQLEKEGFGVLTEIKVTDTLNKKLDVDFQKYQILGACNAPYAQRPQTRR